MAKGKGGFDRRKQVRMGQANALRIAGGKQFKDLKDAEKIGVWTFAWLPETSGKVELDHFKKVEHDHFKIDMANGREDPVDRLNPYDQHMAAFVDAFARRPDAVISLLKKFRRFICEECGRPGQSTEHATLISYGTTKAAASIRAEAEAKPSKPTTGAVASAERGLRRRRQELEKVLKPYDKSPDWPVGFNRASGDPIIRKQHQKADKPSR